jgi:acetylornithine deacetylase/succinyl-diaminopimelate desuccinylase-like protein
MNMEFANHENNASVYEYIDKHRGEHLEKLKEIIRIPSIAAENPEGVRKCAAYLENEFKRLGCRDVEIYETRGQPVVYANYDAGAQNTLAVYLMYDVKQVSGENWTLIKDPFSPEVVPMQPFNGVLVGRGATNSKGPLMAFLNALFSIRESGFEIPVNLKFIAEGEEELGSAHLMDFIKENLDRLREANAVFSPSGSQSIKGDVTLSLGCKGVTEFELVCSGKSWRRGPIERGIHSSMNAIVESPVWRLVQALASMTDPSDPSKVLINGFYDNVAPPTKEDLELIDQLAKVYDEEAVKRANGIEHFYKDLHGKELLMKAFYTTTLNIQGLYAGYTGPLFKTVLPEAAVAKLESRLIPNQTMTETVEKVRKHLDEHGYYDIEIREYPEANGVDDWSRTDPKAGIVKKTIDAYREAGFEPQVWPFMLGSAPRYMFTKPPLSLPFIGAGLGHGARAHAPDEYYVVEGNDKVKGLAETEKFYVSLLIHYSNGRLN